MTGKIRHKNRKYLPPNGLVCHQYKHLSPTRWFTILLSYRNSFLPVSNPEPQLTHAHWSKSII